MSYDITLNDPVTREAIEFESSHEMAGGTYAAGGTTEAWLNVTCNYARWYYRDDVFGKKGIRTIYGMSGADSIPILQKAISALESCTEDISVKERRKFETEGATGYWTPTRKNDIRPLYQLLAMAKLRPDGVWCGD